MPNIDPKYTSLVLEAIEELLYRIALRLEELKGGPMNAERKELTKKQRDLETLQHQLINDRET